MDERTEAIAALLEIAELVEGGAGGREEDDGTGPSLGARGLARAGDGGGEIARARHRHGPRKRCREFVAGAADEEGVTDAREEGRQRLDPARLGDAACDPI